MNEKQDVFISEEIFTTPVFFYINVMKNIKTLRELSKYTAKELREFRGIGKIRLNEIIKVLEIHGLRLTTKDERKNICS